MKLLLPYEEQIPLFFCRWVERWEPWDREVQPYPPTGTSRDLSSVFYVSQVLLTDASPEGSKKYFSRPKLESP